MSWERLKVFLQDRSAAVLPLGLCTLSAGSLGHQGRAILLHFFTLQYGWYLHVEIVMGPLIIAYLVVPLPPVLIHLATRRFCDWLSYVSGCSWGFFSPVYSSL